jgi:hypothetical protein
MLMCDKGWATTSQGSTNVASAWPSTSELETLEEQSHLTSIVLETILAMSLVVSGHCCVGVSALADERLQMGSS